MSSIKASIAAAINAMNSAGKELVEGFVPAPVPEVPAVKAKPMLPPPAVRGAISELVNDGAIQQVVPQVATLPVAEPEPEVVEETPAVEVFFDNEVLDPEPTVVATPKLALRTMSVALKATAPTTLSPKLQASLTALQTSMTNFAPIFNNGVKNTKVQEAGLADNALELSGMTNAQVITALEADLTAHAATYGQSHNLTPAQAGTYSQTQVNTKVAAKAGYASFPVSRYGELSYLPVNVAGSFEGATNVVGTYGETRNYPGIVEDDGTYVFLRNGTTGSKSGVYYAYVKNVLNATDLTPVRTNRKYSPSYFPSGYTAGYVTRSDISGGCIFGRLQDANGNLSNWFLSITSKTFDDSKHIGVIINAANLPAQPISNAYPEVFLGNSAVFMIFPTADLANNTGLPLEYQIYTIPLTSIVNGATVVPTALTGWTISSFYGQNISSTNMRFANSCVDAVANQPAVIRDPTAQAFAIIPFYPNQMGNCTYSAQGPDGNIRTRIMCMLLVQNPATGEQLLYNQFYTFVWSPTSKTGGLEAPGNGPITVSLNSATNKQVVTGLSVIADRSPYSSGNWMSGESLAYHPSGYWLSVVDQTQPDYPCWVTRVKLNAGALTPVNALAIDLPITGAANTTFNPAYGSAVGGGLMGSFQLPNNRVLVFGNGKNAAGNYQRDLILAQKGADGYTYNSEFFGSLTGFAPNTYRQFVTDLGLTPVNYAPIISEITAAGGITCTGAQYMEGISNTGFTNCDSNLVLTGSTSIDPSLYAIIRAAMLSALGVTAKSSILTIVVPQNTSIPPFAVMDWISNASVPTDNIAMAELAITAGSRSGAITGLSLLTVSSNVQVYPFANEFIPSSQNYQYATMGGGVTIYEGTDCWMVGGCTKQFIDRILWSGTSMYRFAIPKSTNRPDWTRFHAAGMWTTFESVFWGGVPGKGFGEFQQEIVRSDSDTKLLFRPFATNLATYDAWTAQAQANWSVQVSQDVAQGWIVYFTDIQPCIMNGGYHAMQPATIDLTTIQANPANTTFYVYIVVTNGVAAYVIRTTDQAESPSVMFIGTVVTNATQISTINMTKVTRLGNYRVSTTRGGSSIPASVGTPDTTSSLAWK